MAYHCTWGYAKSRNNANKFDARSHNHHVFHQLYFNRTLLRAPMASILTPSPPPLERLLDSPQGSLQPFRPQLWSTHRTSSPLKNFVLEIYVLILNLFCHPDTSADDKSQMHQNLRLVEFCTVVFCHNPKKLWTVNKLFRVHATQGQSQWQKVLCNFGWADAKNC